MFSNVLKCSQVWSNVLNSAQIFSNVLKCFQLCSNVSTLIKCSQMFSKVLKCSQMFSSVLKCALFQCSNFYSSTLFVFLLLSHFAVESYSDPRPTVTLDIFLFQTLLRHFQTLFRYLFNTLALDIFLSPMCVLKSFCVQNVFLNLSVSNVCS